MDTEFVEYEWLLLYNFLKIIIMTSSVTWYRRHLGKIEKSCTSISETSPKKIETWRIVKYSPWGIRFVNDDVIGTLIMKS